MILFHASHTQLVIGSRLISKTRILDPGKEVFERRLAEHAPDGFGDRAASIFATEKPASAARYLEAELNMGQACYLYRVNAVSRGRHPMALIDVAGEVVDHEVFSRVACEYWRPTRSWRFWEHLCSEIEVLSTIAWPSTIDRAIAFEEYTDDLRQARAIWGQPGLASSW